MGLSTHTYPKSSKLKLFTSLDTLKILTFWNIIKEKNILLLDFDYYDGKKYSDDQKHEIELLWFRLYDEYFVLINDNKSKHELSKSFSELKIRDKITQIKNNYDFLYRLKSFIGFMPEKDIRQYEHETYNRLKIIEPKIKPLYFDGIDANLHNLDRVIKALVNQYNIEHKQNIEVLNKEIKNVFEIVANAESWLERNININDLVVAHWCALKNQVEQKQKAQEKNRHGKK